MSETEDQTLQRICEEVALRVIEPVGWTEVTPGFIEEYAKTVARRYAATVGAGVPEGWRPIETAPQDGTDVLLFWPPGHFGDSALVDIGCWLKPNQFVAHWCRRGRWTPGEDPTYWQPKPAPPSP